MKIYSFILLFICCLVTNAQVLSFDKIIAQNNITPFENQKLIMIDFWATWCAPCIIATEQLEFFQKQNKEKLFIVSVSDESAEKVTKFLKKTPINLMVTVDFSKDYFSKFAVNSRPYSVVVDLYGKLLWKGHPSDFSQKILDDLHKKSLSREEYYNFDSVFKEKFSDEQPILEPFDGLIAVNQITQINDFFSIDTTANKVSFQGSLSDLLSKIYFVSDLQIDISAECAKRIDFKCSTNDWEFHKNMIIETIEKKLMLFLTKSTINKNVKHLVITNSNLLWDTNQIKWSENVNSHIIGTDRITANDVSIANIALILSKAKNDLYVFDGLENKIYDWDFQYLYDDLMKDELETGFGILVQEKMRPIDVYKVESIKKE